MERTSRTTASMSRNGSASPRPERSAARPHSGADERTDRLLIQAFAKLDRTALGIALGALLGLIIFLATNILLLKGGANVGANLVLLRQFFLGYSVTVAGSFVGLAYGFVVGFVLGWLIAFLHNLLVTAYLFMLKFKANLPVVTDVIDPDHS